MTTLFHNVTAVLVDGARKTLPNAFVAVGDGKITAVSQRRPVGFFDEIIDGQGGVLMPGFVNAHTHVAMTLMRGYGGGHDLQTWLQDFIFPAEAKWDERAIRCATALAMAELMAAGVTTVADMYMFTSAVAGEIAAAGLNANVCCGGVQFQDSFDPATHPDCLVQRSLTEQWHGHNGGQILVDASIHGEYTSHAPLWKWMADYARDHGLGMHVHISETRREHQECLARHGKTPIQTLDEYGVWDTRAIAAHCVWTGPEDWALMARKGISAIHNPVSNLKLGSGVAPVPAMLKAGVNVALGTDGVSSNNSHDMFEEMKLAAILHSGVSHDPAALSAWDALEMATLRGARALGRRSGEITVGADADLILVDMAAANLFPCHDVVENLVYAGAGRNVALTMARGRVLYRNGECFTVDLDKVKREVTEYAVPKLFA